MRICDYENIADYGNQQPAYTSFMTTKILHS